MIINYQKNPTSSHSAKTARISLLRWPILIGNRNMTLTTTKQFRGSRAKRNSRSKTFAIEHIPGYQAGCWNTLIFGTVPLWHVCPSQLFHVRFSTCTRHHLFHSLIGIFLCDHHKHPEGRKIFIVVLSMIFEENKEIWKAASKQKTRSDDSYFHNFYRFMQNRTKISIIS